MLCRKQGSLPGRALLLCAGALARIALLRQREAKAAARADFAFHRNRSAVFLDKFLAQQQAKAHQWLGMINADIHSKFSILFGPQRFAETEAAQTEVVAAAKKLLQGLFSAIDTHLNGREYLTDELTIADVYLLVVLNWAAYKEVDLSACKNLQALHARVAANAAVAKVLAQQ